MNNSSKRKTSSKSLIAFCGVLLIMIIAAVVYVFLWQSNRASDNEDHQQASQIEDKFRSEYPDVSEEHRFSYASPSEVEAVFEEGSGLVFLGFPECPWCQKLAPIVNEAAMAEELNKIYYLDIRQARINNDETYQKLVGYLSEYLEKDEEGNPRIFVPDVTAVNKGKVVERFKQEPAGEGEEPAPDAYWTEDRRARAVEQIRQMIKSTRQP